MSDGEDTFGQTPRTRGVESGTGRILGTLGVDGGRGVVTMRDRVDTSIEDLWSALTTPERLVRWLGKFEGEFRLGGAVKATYFASGWNGTMRIDECEQPQHLKLTDTEGGVTEVWLTSDGEGTLLVAEERGMPTDMLRYYGPGVQVHIEDLISYLAGNERFDSDAMCAALEPAYVKMAAEFE